MKNNLYFFVLFVLVGCDPGDDRLTIINNTDHNIVISNYSWLSDTSRTYLNNKRYTESSFMVNQIESKGSFKMLKKGSWEDSFVESDTIIILVHNSDSIIQKRLKKTSKNYDIEQMIYASHNYLKNNDWKIIIDPKNVSKKVRL